MRSSRFKNAKNHGARKFNIKVDERATSLTLMSMKNV